MDSSRWLVLLVSAASVASPWVAHEVEYWRRTRGSAAIIVVVVGQVPGTVLELLAADVPRERVFRLLEPADASSALRRMRVEATAIQVAALLDGTSAESLAELNTRHAVRWRRLVRSAAGVVAVAFAVSVVASFVTTLAAVAAENHRREVEALRLADAAALRSRDVETSALLAVSAYAMHPSPATQSALSGALVSARTLPSPNHVRLDSAVTATSERGDDVLVATASGALYRWSGEQDQPPERLTTLASPVVRMVWMGKGTLLVTRDRRLVAVDEHFAVQEIVQFGGNDEIRGAAWLPQQRSDVLGTSSGHLVVIGAAGARQTTQVVAVAGPEYGITALDVDTASATVVVAGNINELSAWSLSGPKPVRRWQRALLTGRTGFQVSDVHVDAGTGSVAVGTRSGDVHVLRLTDGLPIDAAQDAARPLHGAGQPVLIAGQDGYVVSVGGDRIVRGWRLRDGAALGEMPLSRRLGSFVTHFRADPRATYLGLQDGDLLRLPADLGHRPYAESRHEVLTIATEVARLPENVREVIGSTQASGLVVLSWDRRHVLAVNPVTGAVRRVLDVPDDAVGFGVLATRDLLAVGLRDGTVRFYALGGGPPGIAPARLADRLTGVAVTETDLGRGWIVAGRDDVRPVVRVLTSESGGRVASLATGRSVPLQSVAVLSQGHLVVVDATQTLDRWSVGGHEARRGLTLRPGWYPMTVRPVAGASVFAATALNGDVHLLDPGTLVERGRLTATTGGVWGLAAMGPEVLVAEAGGLYLYDPAASVISSAGEAAGVTGVAAWKDATYAVTIPGRVLAVEPDPASWTKEICDWVGHPLDPGDRARFGIQDRWAPCPR